MQRGHLNRTLAQGANDRVDLASQQHEVARNRRLALARGLEIDGRARAHGRWHLHAVLGNRLRARDAELVDAARLSAPVAQGRVDLLGIDPQVWRRTGWWRSYRSRAQRKRG